MRQYRWLLLKGGDVVMAERIGDFYYTAGDEIGIRAEDAHDLGVDIEVPLPSVKQMLAAKGISLFPVT